MKNSKRNSVFLLIAIVLIISACKSDDPSDSNNFRYPIIDKSSEQVEAFSETSYPINDNVDISEQSSFKIPSPNNDTGVVFGNLMSLTVDQHLSYSKIYLGTKIDFESGDEYIISILENSSPHGLSNQNGDFLISDIPLGSYFLILVTPIDSYPVFDNFGDQIELIIEGGEIIELGEVFVNWPDFD